MSQPINLTHCNLLFAKHLSSRISPTRLNSLKSLSDNLFSQLSQDLDHAIILYNSFPNCLKNSSVTPSFFINTIYIKSIFPGAFPLFTSVLAHLQNHPADLEIVFSEMRTSTYFHHIYELDKPEYLLANLMTLVYRCHLLTAIPFLRDNRAQISSTLEEMSALRFLLGEDNLHYHATRHWILDWEGEGFSQQLSEIITLNTA